ncbi:MAG: hypothetical protein ACM3JJ_08530 [Hyphomicrobiales bacterium]
MDRHDSIAATLGLDRPITRRDLLRRAGLLLGGAAAAAATGCTPVRVLLRDYPDAFDDDDVADRTLAAFVQTIVPGVEGEPAALTRCFRDEAYPFAPYRGFFAADLCKRAGARFGGARFEALDPKRRARVVEDGLRADALTRKLYEGAIFLTQVATLAGIYDDGGAPVIDFPGANDGFDRAEISYPDPARFLATPATASGNPA